MSEQTSAAPAIQRQFVNFAFFKLDPAFRRLSIGREADRAASSSSLFEHAASRA